MKLACWLASWLADCCQGWGLAKSLHCHIVCMLHHSQSLHTFKGCELTSAAVTCRTLL
jgi:hypothetical protein